MLVRRVGVFLLALILIMSISGCVGEKPAAKDYLLEALKNNESMEDFNFSGELDVQNLQYVENASIAFAGKAAMSPLYLESENRLITTIEDSNLFVDITALALDQSLYINVPLVLQDMIPELDREYLRFTNEESGLEQIDENWFIKMGEILTELSTESFTYAKTSDFSIVKGRASEAVTVKAEKLTGNFSTTEFSDLEVTFVFDRSDDLRQVVFAGDYSKAEYLAVSSFGGKINIIDTNKGITTKREAPAANQTLDYDDIVLPPSIK